MTGIIEQNTELIASIYEAGAMPDKWPNTLKKITTSCNAQGAILLCANEGFKKQTTSLGFEDIVQEFADSKFVDDNPRIGKLMDYLPHPGFVSDAMLHSPDELKNLPIFKDYFEPRGLEAGAATAIYGATGDGIILTIEGFDSHETANISIEYLNGLRPHLARSALLSWQLALRQAQAAVDAMQIIGTAAAMLGHTGEIVAANSLFEQSIGNFVLHTRDRIRAADRRAEKRLEKSVDLLLKHQCGSSLAIPNIDTGISSAMHLLPIVGDARDVFQSSTGLVILANVENSSLPDTDLLEALFDLTPSEAALGRKIGASKTLKEIAKEQNISIETIRWHLKNLMEKTGQSRQSELMKLVKSQAPPNQF